jgi:hypothetical protein
VTAVEPPAFVGKGNALRVHVHGVHARLSFKTLGASRMVVTVAHGSSSRSMIVNEGSVHMDLGPYPNEPGYALVLFRNSGGHDFSAIGLSLPSGSYPQG